MYIIYKITRSSTGESYIGLTKDLDQRISHHRLPSSDCTRLRNAIQKHGWDEFVVEVLEQVSTLEEANSREEVLIYEHHTISPHGYNLQSGGEHRVLSEESKLKISKTLTGRTRPDDVRAKCSVSHTGKVLSQEHKDKIKATRLRGVPRSDETKAKISAAQKGKAGRPGCADNFKKWREDVGPIKLTDEHREKIRAARTGTKRSEETKAKIRAAALARTRQPANSPEDTLGGNP